MTSQTQPDQIQAAIQRGIAQTKAGNPALLARYQAKRRPDTLALLMGMHGLERLFSNSIPPVRLARRPVKSCKRSRATLAAR
jgi:2-octaprenyl-6-methoxyphenol hydroxylase